MLSGLLILTTLSLDLNAWAIGEFGPQLCDGGLRPIPPELLSKAQSKYTPEAYGLLGAAHRTAKLLGQPRADSLHILQEMLVGRETKVESIAAILKQIGADKSAILASINSSMAAVATGSKTTGLTDNYLRVALPFATEESVNGHSPKVTSDYLLLAMCRPEMAKTHTGKALQAGGVTYEKVSAAIKKTGASPSVEESVKDSVAKAIAGDHSQAANLTLAEIGRDLTELARQGKLDPVIGRQDTIERVLTVMGRRQQNNPLLVGDSGVGLTTILEGTAQRIVSGDVPPYLRGKKLILIQVSDLVAGTKHRGEFEARMKAILQEVTDSNGEIILCVDGIETVVGAGGTDGGTDMSTMLGQALKRDGIRVIGTTNPPDFRKKFEKNKIAGKFQKIDINAPELDQALEIVQGAAKKYEEHHNVRYTPDALKTAVELSDRYLNDKEMPAKAISLLDAAASDARFKYAMRSPEAMESLWTRYNALHAKYIDLINAGKHEEATLLQTGEINKLWDQMDPLVRSSDSSIKNAMKLALLNVRLRELNAQLEPLTKTGKTVEVSNLTAKIAFITHEAEEVAKTVTPPDMIMVTVEDIESEVERRTGIPVGKRKAEEIDFSLNPEQRLRTRVVGQEPALKAVGNVIKNVSAQTNKAGKPLGSMLFLGTTGTGKTALAKALAELKFGDKDALIKLDMSEYMDKSSASRLVGASPGYIGYEEGGQLTEKVRRHPYAVVLLDELEKASPEVRKVFLQMLDEGRLTDGQGRLIKFDNVIIIGTTNVGAKMLIELRKASAAQIEDLRSKGTPEDEILKKTAEFDSLIQASIQKALEDEFSPELVARFQVKVVFNQLTRNEYRMVVEKSMLELQNTLGPKKLQLKLKITDEALDLISSKADVEHEGARGLENIFTNHVQPLLSEEILRAKIPGNEGNLPIGSTIGIMDREGQIYLHVIPPGEALSSVPTREAPPIDSEPTTVTVVHPQDQHPN